MTEPAHNGQRWWERGVIYQVYPRSFQDSNGDGVGDLSGIVQRLDYLVWLGIDAVWLSPIYPSPMADFGYDVSNYTDVHPLFGTLADFDELVSQVHARGLRIILDFVPNHTSSQHPWFRQSRSSRNNPRRDWYIWHDPAPDGGPPTNWLSVFGGSAWELDATTGQYYYHAYLREQPDLNWRNPEVHSAMLDVLRFWLDRGVDGFRVDVIWHLVKDVEFRDNPVNPAYQAGQAAYRSQLASYTTDQPEVHEIIAEMRSLLDRYGDRVLIGEIYLPVDRLVVYYGIEGRGAHLPFNFQLIELAWDPQVIARAIEDYEEALPPGGWPNWVLGNHDKPRIASRVGAAQARVAAMLLLTLRGTPTMYYGDEIGMHDVPIPPEAVHDPWEKNVPGLGLGRDPERTPMQWSPEPGAGFTGGRPWLPLPDDYSLINVQSARADDRSLLTLCYRLIELRRAEPALHAGDYTGLSTDGKLLAYLRAVADRRFLVVLNFGEEPAEFPLTTGWDGRLVLSTTLERAGERVSAQLVLEGNEGVVVALE